KSKRIYPTRLFRVTEGKNDLFVSELFMLKNVIARKTMTRQMVGFALVKIGIILQGTYDGKQHRTRFGPIRRVSAPQALDSILNAFQAFELCSLRSDFRSYQSIF